MNNLSPEFQKKLSIYFYIMQFLYKVAFWSSAFGSFCIFFLGLEEAQKMFVQAVVDLNLALGQLVKVRFRISVFLIYEYYFPT